MHYLMALVSRLRTDVEDSLDEDAFCKHAHQRLLQLPQSGFGPGPARADLCAASNRRYMPTLQTIPLYATPILYLQTYGKSTPDEGPLARATCLVVLVLAMGSSTRIGTDGIQQSACVRDVIPNASCRSSTYTSPRRPHRRSRKRMPKTS
jgi:hypothetical protein